MTKPSPAPSGLLRHLSTDTGLFMHRNRRPTLRSTALKKINITHWTCLRAGDSLRRLNHHTELDDLPPDVQTPILALGWLVWFSTATLSAWSTWIAFRGGSIPLIGSELAGGIGLGTCWFLFIAPTMMVVGHCISVLLISGLALVLGTFSRRRAPRH